MGRARGRFGSVLYRKRLAAPVSRVAKRGQEQRHVIVFRRRLYLEFDRNRGIKTGLFLTGEVFRGVEFQPIDASSERTRREQLKRPTVAVGLARAQRFPTA